MLNLLLQYHYWSVHKMLALKKEKKILLPSSNNVVSPVRFTAEPNNWKFAIQQI
jgi:hypothetical protein